MTRQSYSVVVSREVSIAQKILDSKRLLGIMTNAGLNQRDFEHVVLQGEVAAAANAAQVGAFRSAKGLVVAPSAAVLSHALGAVLDRARLAAADAREDTAHKANAALDAEAAQAEALFSIVPRASRRRPPPEGRKPRQHRSRAAGAIAEQALRVAEVLGGLALLGPYLKARGVTPPALKALTAAADAVPAAGAQSAEAHGAAHAATAVEHAAVSEALRGWAKVGPTLHRLARSEPLVKALFR